jgi:reactive intermediate/imine deaminase
MMRGLVASILLCLVGFNPGSAEKHQGGKVMETQSSATRFINPPGLAAPRGYSHVADTKGGRTIYVAGQVSLDKSGNIVGQGNFRAQTEQVFENIKTALEAAGASFKDVVKLNYYLNDTSDIIAVREVRDKYVNTTSPPASTLVAVKRLVREEFLIEVEAIAVVYDR